MTKEGDLSCGDGHAGKTQLSVGTIIFYQQEPWVGKTFDDINAYNN